MPAPIPTPSGVVHIRLGWTIASSIFFGGGFDMGYAGSGLDSAQLADVAGDVATQYATDMVGLFQSQVSLTSVTCGDLQNPSTVDGSVAVSHVGTRSGSYMTTGVCASLAFNPNRKYRGSRPKIFLPAGVSGDLTTDQKWGSAFIADVEAAWLAFTADIVTNSPAGITLQTQRYVNYDGPPYAVVSNSGKTRSHSVPTKVDPPGVYGILGVTMGAKVASQRRRLGKPF